MHILLIDDDAVDRSSVHRALRCGDQVSYDIEDASDAKTAQALLNEKIYDCILLDYRLPDATGLEVLEAVGRSPNKEVPVIMLTGEGSEAVAVKALKNGATDYIIKTELSTDSLARSIHGALEKAVSKREVRHIRRQLEEIALHDMLTGLGSRDLFFQQLDHYTEVANRSGNGFALLIIDLDRFKQINDSHGHQIGDTILETIGERMRLAIRDSDRGFRIGGDEFAILTNFKITRPSLKQRAERVHEALVVPIVLGDASVAVSASTGIAIFPEAASSARELVGAADKAMHAAKASGLDVSFAAESTVPSARRTC